MRVSVLCHLVTLINISVSLVPTSMSGRSHKLAGRLMMSFEPCDDAEPRRGSSKAVLGRIDDLVNAAPIVLFMKGDKESPSCGFSRTMCMILDKLSITYEAYDVLADDTLRQGIKDYSEWPTIPQLFLCGEFVGGSDIALELYKSGELLEMIEVAVASE
mmetsp:Transcript_53091/g.106467  ORF Transcript_53091/g.106467 Transcript_53091/m.106467 type:complete len:159 (+) Transcript_53091:47-523(+)